jgi:hypothetical protein
MKKHHLFILMIAAAAFMLAGCGKNGGEPDEPPVTPPELSVTPASIPATAAAGSYAVTVTSNTAWTATVSSAASWCTLDNAAATGNGTVTVNAAANTATDTRAATVTVAAGTLTRTVSVTQDAFIPLTPPNAASTQTWGLGEQTWSDAIHIPACSGTSFTESYTEPQCCSYTEGDSTWYYYNWPYVNANKNTLCPSPWRVPTHEDFITLANNVDGRTLGTLWGYGGYANGRSIHNYTETYGLYWASTACSSDCDCDGNCDGDRAHHLDYSSGYISADYDSKELGFQVRCVK